MKHLKKLTQDEQKERDELLATWHNEPDAAYIITASGTLTPAPKNDFDSLRDIREMDMVVDGAE